MTINGLGAGPEEIKKKNSEALLQEKRNFERHSPGKKEILRGTFRGKTELYGTNFNLGIFTTFL